MKRALPWILGLAFAASIPPNPAGAAPTPASKNTSSGQTYRWVDSDGVTHYSDQVPPDQAQLRRSKLDAQGREVGVIEAPKTAEQLRRERQLKQLRAQQDKILAEQRDRDLSLLRTYHSEQEMYRALQSKLDTLDGLVRIAEINRQHQQDNLRGHERRAADMERQGQAVPQSQRDLIASTRRQMDEFSAQIRNLEADQRDITERFAKDIARYRAIAAQLKNPNELGSELLDLSSGGRQDIDDIVISAISCAVGPICNRAWSLAKEYIQRQAPDTRLSLETEKILQTPSPLSDNDFGMTVTRIAGKTEDILFFDVRCRASSIGEALCAGAKVREVRLGFRPYVEAGLDAVNPSAANPK